MDLCDPAMEAAFHWLGRTVDFDKDCVKSLTWRVPTNELYHKYKDWVRQTNLRSISIEELWGIIQLVHSFVEIVGAKGNRVYTGARWR